MTIGGALIRRRLVVPAVVVSLLVAALSWYVVGRAVGDAERPCARLWRVSAERQDRDVGAGPRIVVIGDSYSVGAGLDRVAESWPSRLPGRVHVAGFSGSGFSAGSSPCTGASYADRAADAVAGGAELVVVEGGLNDTDRSNAEISAGFERLMRALDGHRVLIVGPAAAPSRLADVPRVDAVLAELSAAHGATYLPMVDVDLAYLDDDLHPTTEGHATFGDVVGRAVTGAW